MKELPAKIKISPIARPCVNVEINGDSITWRTGPEPGQDGDDDFVKETDFLLTVLGGDYFGIEWDLIPHLSSWEFLIRYLEKWGPLMPFKPPVKLLEFSRLGYTASLCAMLWNYEGQVHEEIVTAFFSVAKAVNDGVLCAEELSGVMVSTVEKPLWWMILPELIDGKASFHFYGGRKKVKDGGVWIPYLKHPTKRDFERIDFNKDNRIDWVRSSLLQNVSDYLNKQSLNLKAVIKGSNFHLAGSCNNLFAAYLFNKLLGPDKSLQFCDCGCGQLVPPGRKKYASAQCWKKTKEGTAKRKITKWLEQRRRRGTITEELCKDLINQADEMLTDGQSEFDVRGILEEMMKEGLTNGRMA